MSFVRFVGMSIGFAVLAAASLTAQRNSIFISGHSSLSIPVEINNNLILVETRLNGKRPLKLIFDTGASATVINADLQEELGIKGTEKMDGTATGGNIEGTMAKGVKIAVKGVVVPDQPVGLIAMPRIPGFDFDGAIGWDFIKQVVVEIDYLNKVMNLYAPGRYRYRGKGTTVPFDLKGRQTPLLNASFLFPAKRSVIARLELDTGADNAFLLYAPFFEKRQLLTASNIDRTNPGRGAGGETERALYNATSTSLGPFTFRNVPVLFSFQRDGLEDGVDGIVGGEILRRFKLIIDYSRSRMILEPNKDLKKPIEVDG